MKRHAAILLAAILAAVMPFTTAYAAARRIVPCAQAGSYVGGFDSVCLNGDTIDGSVFEGYSASVITYFATWSPESLQQLDYLAAVHAQRPDIGVFGLLHTDATSTAAAAQSYMQAHGYNFPVFEADAVWTSVVSQAPYIPQSFIVSPGGVVFEAYTGAFPSAADMLGSAVNWAGQQGTYTVRFYDRIGGACTLLAVYGGLSYGASVTAPAAPHHAGYEFTGWSTSAYNYVTGNIDVFAVYQSNGPDGDANGDGVTDSNDALAVLRAVLRLTNVTPVMLEHGDMDSDGAITSYDALLLLRLVMHVL